MGLLLSTPGSPRASARLAGKSRRAEHRDELPVFGELVSDGHIGVPCDQFPGADDLLLVRRLLLFCRGSDWVNAKLRQR